MQQRVLVADDEEKIAKMVGSYLEASGYTVTLARDGRSALAAFRSQPQDCLVLDINMPFLDGFDVAREVRKSSQVPIIFLSARADELDKVLGLELGADDYVSKPFSPRELVARVRAVLRRSSAGGEGEAREDVAEGESGTPTAGAGASRLRLGELELDFRKRSVRVGGDPKILTAIQFDMLAFLMREPGRVYTRLEMLEGSSGSAYEGYERTIDAHVKNIRKALGDDSESPRFIGTVRGVGYRFIEPEK